MNLTTTAIITKGLFGGAASQLIGTAFDLSYLYRTPVSVPVTGRRGGGGSGGGGSGASPSIAVNYSSNMFNDNSDYLETILVFNGDKKMIQHYLKYVKVTEFMFISHDVNFARFNYLADVEVDNNVQIEGNATLH